MQLKGLFFTAAVVTVSVASAAPAAAGTSQICGYPNKACPENQKCTVRNDCMACQPGGNRFAFCAGFCYTKEDWSEEVYGPFDEFDGYDGHKFANCNYD